VFHTLKETIKHASVYGIADLLQKGAGFFLIPLYTHYLAPTEYGIIELLDLSAAILTMLISMGMSASIIRFYHAYETKRDKQEVFSTALLTIIGISALMVCLLQLFPERVSDFIFGTRDHYHYFQILYISMGLQTIATVPETLLLAEKRSGIYSAVTIGTFFSYLALNLLFIVGFRMAVMGLLLSMLITKTLNTSVLLLLTSSKWQFALSWAKLRNLLAFGLPLIPGLLAMFVVHYADRFIIQRLCDSHTLGIYSLGYKFGMIISIIICQPFFRIWNTQRYEIANTNNAPLLFGRVFTYFLTFLLVGAFAITLFADNAISIMAPLAYQNASRIVWIVAAGYVLNGCASFYTLGMVLNYRTGILALIQLAVAFLNVPLSFVLIGIYGIYGAACATFLTFLAFAGSSFVFSQRLFPIDLEYARILKLVFIVISFSAISKLIGGSLPIALLLKSVLFLMLLPGLLFVGFFNEKEKETARKLIQFLHVRAFSRRYEAFRRR
jgi:O-antigen/teichoic acid export membrane protein